MTRYRRVYRGASLLLTAVVATLTLGVMLHATQTITTPNASITNYSLAPGANSAAITPATSTPVLVMGVQNTVGFRGTGFVSLLHVPASFLEWVGLESTSGAAITQGFSAAPGTHIVYLDFSHVVDIRVNSADTFVIHNGGAFTATGVVKMIW